MSDTERRWADRAWDVGVRVMGVLLMAISCFFYARQNDMEKEVQALKIKVAVVDTEKNTIMINLGEIKSDIRDIKDKMKP